jgi:hypothetical protein
MGVSLREKVSSRAAGSTGYPRPSLSFERCSLWQAAVLTGLSFIENRETSAIKPFNL